MRARSHIFNNSAPLSEKRNQIGAKNTFIMPVKGKIISKYNPNNEKQKNIEQSFYNNGNIEYEAEWHNDKLDGVSRYWSIDGNLISEAQYSSGKLHGVTKKYFPNTIAAKEGLEIKIPVN